MLRCNYLRSIFRLAIHSRSKTRHAVTNPRISELATRRYDTLDTICGLIRSTKRRPQRRLWPPLHPAHLTKSVPYQTSQVRKSSSRGSGSVAPGGVFVVNRVVAKAAVQDAHEAVAERA